MGGKVGLCHLCNQQSKLIHAHIMPKCFQKPVRGSDNSLYIYHKDTHTYQDTFDFLYDKELLCKSCDNTFSPSENYTAKFFADVRSGRLKPIKRVEHTEEEVDYYFKPDLFMIKNCILSILWRMGITGRKEYKSVDLGDLKELLRDRLNDKSIMDPFFFPFSILSLDHLGDVRADLMAAFVPTFKFADDDLHLIHIPGFLIFIHATVSPSFDPYATSFRDDETFVICEDKRASLKSLDYLYKFPFIPRSKTNT